MHSIKHDASAMCTHLDQPSSPHKFYPRITEKHNSTVTLPSHASILIPLKEKKTLRQNASSRPKTVKVRSSDKYPLKPLMPAQPISLSQDLARTFAINHANGACNTYSHARTRGGALSVPIAMLPNEPGI